MKNRPMIIILLVFLVLGIHCPVEGNPVDENTEIGPLRDVLEKWVETKQLISSEKQKWQNQKEVLTDRTRLLESQVQDLDRKIKETREAIEKTGEKREELSAKYKQLESAGSLLRERIALLEAKTLRLLSQLPNPVQEQVEPLSQEIPADPERTELPLSTRYQNLIGVLNYVNKFNNAVTVTTEVRELNGNQTVEVKVMYLGLGQAYFSNDTATVGGVGHPTTNGWKWERRDNIAPAVSSAIAMYNNEKPADYVALPVEILKLREGL
ncbi:MAG: DUF3450 family protein [Deltaproteobacteria bacterium]|nr:DUF3450 family protein [Deltaproteobacteria bacterium]